MITRWIARYLATRYPGQLLRLLAANEANIAAVLENLADRPEAFTIAAKLRRHAGDERHHATLLFRQLGRDDLATTAGKRLDRRSGDFGENQGIAIRGLRKRLPIFKFLFLGQDPLKYSWPNLFALITLLESHSVEFYDELRTVPGWEFSERIYRDEVAHAELWPTHWERLLYWRCRVAIAISLTIVTGGLNLSKQTLI